MTDQEIRDDPNRRPSVASVTVAWNAARKLSDHLSALSRQTVPLAEIIVVDNASSDDTLKLLTRDFPQVTVVPMSCNCGVGGGFSTGLRHALMKGHEWYWTFDQDSIPIPAALEALLSAWSSFPQERKDDIGILATLPIDRDKGVEHPGLVWRSRLLPIPAQRAAEPIHFVDSVISSGSLIRRDVLEGVGLPREDFFMDFVDHEYNLRIRRAGYRIAVVKQSIMFHSLGDVRAVKRFPWERYRVHSFQPAWRHYYMGRNETFTVWHLFGQQQDRMFLIIRMLKRALDILWFEESKRAKLRMHFSGVWDGLRGNLERQDGSVPGAGKSKRRTRVQA